ncbi:hypothetical protein HK098_007057 [Nowakowskiella sp. JEL0407]|nr:hypothetical protein HK098_007057 [Nowakowskiella sp. JEL0407]
MQAFATNAVCTLCKLRGGSVKICKTCASFYHTYCLPPLPISITSIHILIIHASRSSQKLLSQLKPALESTTHFARIDDLNLKKFRPTFELLSKYHSILILTNTAKWVEPEGLGDLLSDYVHFRKGGVVLVSTNHNEAPGGKWRKYRLSPLLPGREKVEAGLEMGKIELSGHPLLDGVGKNVGLEQSTFASAALNESGGTIVARWSNGQPLVAVLDDHPSAERGRVVSLNLAMKLIKNENGDVVPLPPAQIQLLSNSLRFVAEPTYHKAHGEFYCDSCQDEIKKGNTPTPKPHEHRHRSNERAGCQSLHKYTSHLAEPAGPAQRLVNDEDGVTLDQLRSKVMNDLGILKGLYRKRFKDQIAWSVARKYKIKSRQHDAQNDSTGHHEDKLPPINDAGEGAIISGGSRPVSSKQKREGERIQLPHIEDKKSTKNELESKPPPPTKEPAESNRNRKIISQKNDAKESTTAKVEKPLKPQPPPSQNPKKRLEKEKSKSEMEMKDEKQKVDFETTKSKTKAANSSKNKEKSESKRGDANIASSKKEGENIQSKNNENSNNAEKILPAPAKNKLEKSESKKKLEQPQPQPPTSTKQSKAASKNISRTLTKHKLVQKFKLPWLEMRAADPNRGYYKLNNTDRFSPWLDWNFEIQYSLNISKNWKPEPPSLTSEQWSNIYETVFTPSQQPSTPEKDDFKPWTQWPEQKFTKNTKFGGDVNKPWLDWITNPKLNFDRTPWTEWKPQPSTLGKVAGKLTNGDKWKPWLDWWFDLQYAINKTTTITQESGMTADQWKAEYDKQFIPKPSTNVVDSTLPWVSKKEVKVVPKAKFAGDLNKPWLDWIVDENPVKATQKDPNSKSKNKANSLPWTEWPTVSIDRGTVKLNNTDRAKPWLDWRFQAQYAINQSSKIADESVLSSEKWAAEYGKSFVPKPTNSTIDPTLPWVQRKEVSFKPKGKHAGDKWKPWLDWGGNNQESSKTKSLPWLEWPVIDPHSGKEKRRSPDPWKPWLNGYFEVQYAINQRTDIQNDYVLSNEDWQREYEKPFVPKQSNGVVDDSLPWRKQKMVSFVPNSKFVGDLWRPWLDWGMNDAKSASSKKEKLPWLEWPKTPKQLYATPLLKDKLKPWLDWKQELQYTVGVCPEVKQEGSHLTQEEWQAEYAKEFTPKPASVSSDIKPWTEWKPNTTFTTFKSTNTDRPWIDWVSPNI